MCLIINQVNYPDLKPATAKNDIFVYKLLSHVNDTYRTPYMNYPIHFRLGKSIVKSKLLITPISHGAYYTVTEGIYAYLKQNYLLRFRYPDEYIFKAVIPKGAHYFIGDKNIVVADKMIIFDEIIK